MIRLLLILSLLFHAAPPARYTVFLPVVQHHPYTLGEPPLPGVGR